MFNERTPWWSGKFFWFSVQPTVLFFWWKKMKWFSPWKRRFWVVGMQDSSLPFKTEICWEWDPSKTSPPYCDLHGFCNCGLPCFVIVLFDALFDNELLGFYWGFCYFIWGWLLSLVEMMVVYCDEDFATGVFFLFFIFSFGKIVAVDTTSIFFHTSSVLLFHFFFKKGCYIFVNWSNVVVKILFPLFLTMCHNFWYFSLCSCSFVYSVGLWLKNF